ncbi:hypothetical protein [Actinocatenispora rupis]|uniref:Uncharacterized protein n=1 Tax=Actinocatenispora rupis TaxID=519421 RepID=A0A8J3J2X4_9ACTN|nr:hypothetical protein [Actinocatenispora rupis]GID10997.1 hypothetical protein Aru02nite_18860 [Actinocatenispora rupis]
MRVLYSLDGAWRVEIDTTPLAYDALGGTVVRIRYEGVLVAEVDSVHDLRRALPPGLLLRFADDGGERADPTALVPTTTEPPTDTGATPSGDAGTGPGDVAPPRPDIA